MKNKYGKMKLNYSGNKLLTKEFSQGYAVGQMYLSILFYIIVLSIVYCVTTPT